MSKADSLDTCLKLGLQLSAETFGIFDPKERKLFPHHRLQQSLGKVSLETANTGPGLMLKPSNYCVSFLDEKLKMAEALDNPVDSNNSAHSLYGGVPEESSPAQIANHRWTDTQVRNPPCHTPCFHLCQIMETFSFRDWQGR